MPQNSSGLGDFPLRPVCRWLGPPDAILVNFVTLGGVDAISVVPSVGLWQPLVLFACVPPPIRRRFLMVWALHVWSFFQLVSELSWEHLLTFKGHSCFVSFFLSSWLFLKLFSSLIVREILIHRFFLGGLLSSFLQTLKEFTILYRRQIAKFPTFIVGVKIFTCSYVEANHLNNIWK